MTSDAIPPEEVQIDDALVGSLLRAQFPDLAILPLGTRHEGGDNVTIRLGDTLAVRLPRRGQGETHIATEFGWRPSISTKWTFPVSRPIRMGQPTESFPWRWSVVTWLDGVPAYDSPLSAEGARDLGLALAQVHVAMPPNAPRNPFRSTPLAARAERLSRRLEALIAWHGNVVHPDVAHTIFQLGAAQDPGPVTWTHLDLHGLNVITLDGRLGGILEWSHAAAGDPAADLGHAFSVVGERHFEDLVSGYADAGGAAATGEGLSAATTARVRAEALSSAVLLAAIEQDGHSEAGWATLVTLGVADARPSQS